MVRHELEDEGEVLDLLLRHPIHVGERPLGVQALVRVGYPVQALLLQEQVAQVARRLAASDGARAGLVRVLRVVEYLLHLGMDEALLRGTGSEGFREGIYVLQCDILEQRAVGGLSDNSDQVFAGVEVPGQLVHLRYTVAVDAILRESKGPQVFLQ